MSNSGNTDPQNFSPAERSLLSRYVTNTEGSVFALTNLPEVVKGALFSRYSRSAKGLRELLLTDFIQAPESEFAGIGGFSGEALRSGETAAKESEAAVKRAEGFYSRILDSYGDDSIAELGGAHLAIENVSMIATKVLEDARIGGSPLEKSTRYVFFGDKVDGEYLFYQEPALMDSAHRELYLNTNRALFETYREMIGPLTAYVEQAAQRDPGASAAAWRRSVRAGWFEGLRGFRPATALANMGIYGNGRFFETLLIRLQISPLAEMQTLGGAMLAELSKVIPSFVRRADPAHRHFSGFQQYHQSLTAFTERAPIPSAEGPIAPGGDPPEEPSPVKLVDWDPAAPRKVLASLYFSGSGGDSAPLLAWAGSLSETERSARFQELADLRENRRHKPPRALELAFYTFDLTGDFGMYRDLHRHRMLTQQRQPLSARLGYEMPEEIAGAGLQSPFAAAMERAGEAYERIAADFPEAAQYVVPMAYRIRWQIHINLRALIWLVELRSSPQGHPAYRRMAQQLFRKAAEVHPSFAPLFKFVDMTEYPLGRIVAEQRAEKGAENST